ncbi:lipoprotein [Leptotrichia massiliensis]|nr:lipoprotein [Leptotrichia massiliensis]
MKKLIILIMILFTLAACSSTGKGTNSIHVGVGFSGL